MSNDFTHVVEKLCPGFSGEADLREQAAVAWERLDADARVVVEEEVQQVTGSIQRFGRLMDLLGVTRL